MTAEPLDLDVPGGRMRVERRGAHDGPLVLLVHGLTANLRSFDTLAAQLAEDDPARQVVALDLRGRGASETTPPGTYGLDAHVTDVLAVADQLAGPGAPFALVGWSMGALIGIALAGTAPGRLTHLGLLDHAGAMDPAAVEAVRMALVRLDAVVPDPDLYVGAIRDAGVITPWSAFWDAVYHYELTQREDGQWTPRTDRAACAEDLELAAELDERWEARWPALTMPVALVRCTAPMNGGLIVPAETAERFERAVPHAQVTVTDRNHYGLVDDPRTGEALTTLLKTPAAA